MRSFPVPTPPFCVALTILALIRAIFIFHPDPLYPLATTTDERFSNIWEQVYRKTMREPKVLIIGSSRLQTMPLARFAANLDLAREEASNLSRPANTFIGIQKFIQRNPEALNHCQLLIIDLLPMQLYKSKYFTQKEPSFFRNADFQEKRSISDPSTRLRALADTIFPFHSLRYTAHQWRIGLTHTIDQKDTWNRSQLEDDVAERTGDAENWGARERIQKVLNNEFPKTDILKIQTRALEKIFEAMPQNTNVLLVRPPYRADVEQIIQTNPQFRDSNNHFRAYIESLTHDNLHIHWMETPNAHGFTDTDYTEDGAHFSPQGRKKFTDQLAIYIQKNNLTPK